MNPGLQAFAIIAEEKITRAIEGGEFDNLPGFGQPFQFDPFQYDPHWWIREKLERESIRMSQDDLRQFVQSLASARPRSDGD